MLNSQDELSIEGTLHSDGTLQLDEMPNVQPGRFTVVLKRSSSKSLSKDDSFWQRMQAMWAIPTSSLDSGNTSLAAVREQREEWDVRQQILEKLSEQCRSDHSEDPKQ